MALNSLDPARTDGGGSVVKPSLRQRACQGSAAKLAASVVLLWVLSTRATPQTSRGRLRGRTLALLRRQAPRSRPLESAG